MPDGYGRLLLLDRDLAGDEPAQLVLRLQELGNYRNMALLGLPLAQRLTPVVTSARKPTGGVDPGGVGAHCPKTTSCWTS